MSGPTALHRRRRVDVEEKTASRPERAANAGEGALQFCRVEHVIHTIEHADGGIHRRANGEMRYICLEEDAVRNGRLRDPQHTVRRVEAGDAVSARAQLARQSAGAAADVEDLRPWRKRRDEELLQCGSLPLGEGRSEVPLVDPCKVIKWRPHFFRVSAPARHREKRRVISPNRASPARR